MQILKRLNIFIAYIVLESIIDFWLSVNFYIVEFATCARYFWLVSLFEKVCWFIKTNVWYKKLSFRSYPLQLANSKRLRSFEETALTLRPQSFIIRYISQYYLDLDLIFSWIANICSSTYRFSIHQIITNSLCSYLLENVWKIDNSM